MEIKNDSSVLDHFMPNRLASVGSGENFATPVSDGLVPFFTSNEPFTYRYFPYIKNKGAVVGVGTDQVLDLVANTQTTVGVIVDYNDASCTLMKTLLEVGRCHKQFFGSNPTLTEIAGYFSRNRLDRLWDFIGKINPEDAASSARKFLERGIDIGFEDAKSIGYDQYMLRRAKLKDSSGDNYAWYSQPDKLNKIINLYSNGAINVVRGDLCDAAAIGFVSDLVEGLRVGVDVIYISNVEEILAANERKYGFELFERFWTNLQSLPVRQDTQLLRTTMRVLVEEITDDGLTEVEDEGFKNILLDWHYNMEQFEHHLKMVESVPSYIRRGWFLKAKKLKEIGQLTEKGFSRLDVDNTPPGRNGFLMPVWFELRHTQNDSLLIP